MATAQQLINQSLRVLGVIGAGETPSAADSADALTALNGLLQSLSLQRLSVYAEALDSKTLIPAQSAYTIGTNGAPDWSTQRPNAIKSAYLRVGQNDYPIQIIDQTTYDSFVDKFVQSAMPNRLFYNATAPNGTIYLYPTPSAANVLYIRSWRLIESFATLSEDIDLPNGWLRALKFGLARELSAEYGKQITQDIERQWLESIGDIKRLNASNRPILGSVMELAGTGRYNVYTDQGG